MTVITRFPPSPTGFMHIGNARTALFNYYYAKAKGGKFLIRIEDTDRKRHSEDAVQAILNGLKWLELDYDNTPVSQFANQARHREIAEELIAKNQAYKCYCSPEELNAMRETAKAEGKPTFYNRKWRNSNETPPEGIKPVIRIKAPLEGSTTIGDEVQGEVTIQNEQLDDFIILRSDGTPTYMLSVVVDDHDMNVTHIIRGDDHLNNAFRQKIIFDAMNWTVPTMAHCPLIHGPDGGKFSKRHGAQSVEEYRDMGYLPEAMRNYLLKLGWGHGDEEIIDDTKAIELFDLGGIGKAPAKFDFAKLENLNAHYIKQCENDRLIELAEPFYQIPTTDLGRARTLKHIDEIKDRAKTLIDFAKASNFYHKTVPFNYDEKAQKLITEGKPILELLHKKITELEDTTSTEDNFTAPEVTALCKIIAQDHADGKLGKVAMPLRAALTGSTQSPSIFEAAAILGKEEVLERLKAAL